MPIDADASGFDQLVGLTARAEAGLSQRLVEAQRTFVLCALSAFFVLFVLFWDLPLGDLVKKLTSTLRWSFTIVVIGIFGVLLSCPADLAACWLIWSRVSCNCSLVCLSIVSLLFWKSVRACSSVREYRRPGCWRCDKSRRIGQPIGGAVQHRFRRRQHAEQEASRKPPTSSPSKNRFELAMFFSFQGCIRGDITGGAIGCNLMCVIVVSSKTLNAGKKTGAED
ncbi:MAG: hypothetical protein U0105_24500 [Candidatus Obscuribacterales bacterium]